MASPFESRSPVGPVLSLADVRAIVADHPTLPRRRRQEMLSALRTVGRVLSKVSAGGISLPDPLARLPADPAFLAQQYRRVAPLALSRFPPRAAAIIRTEFLWIWLPAMLVALGLRAWRREGVPE